MGSATYHISHGAAGWCVRHDRDVSDPYMTREAAFEAALGPASNALKAGDAVTIKVDQPPASTPPLGRS